MKAPCEGSFSNPLTLKAKPATRENSAISRLEARYQKYSRTYALSCFSAENLRVGRIFPQNRLPGRNLRAFSLTWTGFMGGTFPNGIQQFTHGVNLGQARLVQIAAELCSSKATSNSTRCIESKPKSSSRLSPGRISPGLTFDASRTTGSPFWITGSASHSCVLLPLRASLLATSPPESAAPVPLIRLHSLLEFRSA